MTRRMIILKRTIVLFLLLSLTSCGPSVLIPKEKPDPLPPVCVPKEIRVALVLGSGGVRGMAHVGVIEELEKAHIPIDLIVGCSSGSVVGALYADKPHVCAIRNAVYNIKSDSILDIDIWNCRYGLSDGKNIQSILKKNLRAKNFNQLKIPLIVVATDLYTGELVPIAGGDIAKAVQSSCSIPFLFVPCHHMGRIFVDGGVINPIPVQVAHDLGAQIIIAVDLCELLPTTTPSDLFDITTRSAEIAFMWQNEACTRNAQVIIRPKTCGVGTFNDKIKCKIYEAGKLAARAQLPRIKALLSQTKTPRERVKHLLPLKCYKPQIEK